MKGEKVGPEIKANTWALWCRW